MTLREKIAAVKDLWRKNEYKLDPYIINDGHKHPFAIICPGGGYQCVCSFIEGRPFAKKLNEMGISAFVLYYRVREKARFPAPMDDLARAVKEVMAHAETWNLDVNQYAVLGSSAGAHLAASFGTESIGYKKYDLPKPNALILVYPVISMESAVDYESRAPLLGADPSLDLIRLSSIERQATENYPPTFIWYGDAEESVVPENAQLMARTLSQLGVPHQLHVFPGVGHGVGLGEGLSCEGWINQAVDFWLSFSS